MSRVVQKKSELTKSVAPLDARLEAHPSAYSGRQVLDALYGRGETVRSWAEARDFSASLVYEVIRGSRKCLRGQSLQIAKELGMK